jgi:hypothetical protein
MRIDHSFRRVAAAAIVVAVLLTEPTRAYIENQTDIPNGDKVFRNGVAWPAVGHLMDNAGGVLNSFGSDFLAAGSWTTALCNADTDGDGYSNGYELGDPACIWYPGGPPPERITGISHPGFQDSYPTITEISFRLSGPSLDEGVLQARIYPQKWGTVNFHSVKTEWADEYCNKTSASNKTWLPRAYYMKDRPVEDLQYLVNDDYVVISDVSGCSGTDILKCAFAYSAWGSPQNTTKAAVNGIYVNCRYAIRAGTMPYPPVRLLSTDPDRGDLQMYDLDKKKWEEVTVVNYLSGWTYEKFICQTVLGFNTSFKYASAQKGQQKVPMNATLPICDPNIKVLACDINYGLQTGYSYAFYCANSIDRAPFHVGPAVIESVFTIEGDLNVAEYQMSIADFYALEMEEVIIRTWEFHNASNLTYVSLHISTSRPFVNPSIIALSIISTQKKLFGVLAARTEHAYMDWLPQELPPFMIDGPTPDEGVVKAFVNGTWGLVHWAISAAAAIAVCGQAGQLDPETIPRLTTLLQEPGAAPYIGADPFIALSDPGGCVNGKNLTTCQWILSTREYPRATVGINSALYVRCQWTKFPKVRVKGYEECRGMFEIKMDGSNTWRSMWSEEFSQQELCIMAGCDCSKRSGSCSTPLGTSGAVAYVMKWCNITSLNVNDCQIDYYDPPTPKSIQGYTCGVNTPPSPTTCRACSGYKLIGQKERWATFVLTNNASQEEFWNYLAPYNLSHINVKLLAWNVSSVTELTHVGYHIGNDKPSTGISPSSLAFGLPNKVQTDTYSGWQYSDYYYVPPNEPVNETPEFKIDEGPYPWEGYLMARYPSGSWGKVTMDSSYLTTLWAAVACNSTGHFHPGYIARMWTSRYDLQDSGRTPCSPQDYVSFWEMECLQPYMGDLGTGCNWLYNTWTKRDQSEAQRAVYLNCREPIPKFRLKGAFPGTGIAEMYVDHEWGPVISYDYSGTADTCSNRFGYSPPVGYSGSRQYISAGFSEQMQGYAYGCATWATPYLCEFEIHDIYSSLTQYYCQPPPSATPIGGSSIRMLNAAIVTTPNVTKQRFIAMAAAVAGVSMSEVQLSQWNPYGPYQLTYITVTFNSTLINVATALNNLAANSSFGWLSTDIRLVPPAQSIPSSQWEWSHEIQTPNSKRGFVMVRPTAHYSFGLVCFAKWNENLTRTFCETMYGPSVFSWPRPPQTGFQFLSPGNTRSIYVENVMCLPNASDIKACSYSYLPFPTDECFGNANIVVNCQPTTDEIPIASPTKTRSRWPTQTKQSTISITHSNLKPATLTKSSRSVQDGRTPSIKSFSPVKSAHAGSASESLQQSKSVSSYSAGTFEKALPRDSSSRSWSLGISPALHVDVSAPVDSQQVIFGTTSMVAASASTVATVARAVANPSLATLASRQNAIRSLIACAAGLDPVYQAAERDVNPFLWSIRVGAGADDDAARATDLHAGAAIFNSILLYVFSSLVVAASVAYAHIMRQTQQTTGLDAWELLRCGFAWARFPGILSCAYAYASGIVAQSTMVVALSPDTRTQARIGFACFGLITVVVPACVAVSAFRRWFRRVFVPSNTTPTTQRDGSRHWNYWCESTCSWSVVTSVGETAGADRMRQYAFFFGAYTDRAPWFLGADVLLLGVLGGIGSRLSVVIGCNAGAWTLVAVYVSYLIALARYRPIGARFEFLAVTVLAVSQTASVLLAALRLSFGLALENVASAAETVATGASFFAVLFALMTAVVAVKRFLDARRQARKAAANDATRSTSDGSEAPLLVVVSSRKAGELSAFDAQRQATMRSASRDNGDISSPVQNSLSPSLRSTPPTPPRGAQHVSDGVTSPHSHMPQAVNPLSLHTQPRSSLSRGRR